MTYDHELILIKQEKTPQPPGVKRVVIETETIVLCNVKSVSQSEYWKGRQGKNKPEYVFVIHAFEYSGEKIVCFEGKRYSVIRTFQKNFEEIELICEEKAGVSHVGEG